MLRIKGRVGDWPVDLTVEMDAEDWAQLAALLPVEAAPATPRATPVSNPADTLWPLAQQLLQRAGSLEGPQLLSELSALAGGDAAGKRLLVRLRHCPQVQVESGAEAPLYRWVG